MACYHPQVAYIFYDKKTMSHGHTLVFKDFDYKNFETYKLALGTEKTFFNKKEKYDELCVCTDAVLIPCRHCVGCCTSLSREWMHRMVLEKEVSKTSYFLTLTYDEENIPVNHQLNKKHLDDFLKALRNYFKNKYDYDGIRYYACGEYGSKTARPHYHAIIYNLPLTPLEFKVFGFEYDKRYKFRVVGKGEDGTDLYEFDLLNQLWKKGFVVVGQVTDRSCGYVARYVDKKRLSGEKNKDLKACGIVPEFNCMSRMPGIGVPYYEKYYKKILDNNLNIFINGTTISVGRMFEKFLDKYHPEYLDRYKKLKESLSLFGKTQIMELEARGDVNDGLKILEDLKTESFKLLKRKL